MVSAKVPKSGPFKESRLEIATRKSAFKEGWSKRGTNAINENALKNNRQPRRAAASETTGLQRHE
jgi:hypothetical protein